MHASSGRFFSRTISHVFPLACALCSFLVIVSLSTPAFALQAGGSAPVIQAESQRQCGKDWMSRGMIGLSTHYFVLRTEDNERLAAQFDAKKVAEQAADAGAAWFLFTLHHQAWIMMAPNATYDRIVGSGDYTAARDVPLELIRQLDKSGVKLMLYVNLRLDQKSAASALVRDRMGGWPPNDKLIENIAAVYREFSLRYGKNVVGWWVDGARLKEYRNSPNRERWFKTIADALRAGNPEALVAFNPGIEVSRYSNQDDFTAGESVDLVSLPVDRYVDGAQWHAWTYLGGCWGSGGTRFSDQELGSYVSRVTSRGGALTFEVGARGNDTQSCKAPRSRTSPGGYIDPAQIEQIKRIRPYLQVKPPSANKSGCPQ